MTSYLWIFFFFLFRFYKLSYRYDQIDKEINCWYYDDYYNIMIQYLDYEYEQTNKKINRIIIDYNAIDNIVVSLYKCYSKIQILIDTQRIE